MECSEPGAIGDEELLAYLAGEKVRPFVAASCTLPVLYSTTDGV